MFRVAGAQDLGLAVVSGELGDLTEASVEELDCITAEIRTESLMAAEETDGAEFERWLATRGTVAEIETLLIPTRAAAILVRRPDVLLSLECDFDIA